MMRTIQTSNPTTKLISCTYQEICVMTSYGAEPNYIQVSWLGKQSEASIREGCENLLRLMHELKVYRVLNDCKHALGGWPHTLKWLLFDFLPKIQEAGLQRCAHVYADSRATRLSTDSAMLLFDSEEANIQAFRNVKEAIAWLTE